MLRLAVYMDKIVENYRRINALCERHGIELAVVSKLFNSDASITKPLINAGARIFAEANKENLDALPRTVHRMLMRASLGDILGGPGIYDSVFISELFLLEALNLVPNMNSVGVYISVEAGDLRDGVCESELAALVDRGMRMGKGPHIAGFSANYGCMRGYVPQKEDLIRFRLFCDKAAKKAGLKDYSVSMGGTTLFDHLEEGSLVGIADQIRIGEALYLGWNTALGKSIPDLHQDTVILTAEVIEVREKFVSNDDRLGNNAFGKRSPPDISGYRKRAILNFGELSAPIRNLVPALIGTFLVGSTHDHAVLDVTDCENEVESGQLLDFWTDYNSTAHAMLSPLVDKIVFNAVPQEAERVR